MSNILILVESLLGSSKQQGKKGDYLFFCPECNHYKRKLSINIERSSQKFGHWACWVCQDTHDTKGKSLFTLFKKFNASHEQKEKLKELLNKSFYNYSKKISFSKSTIQLPKEFVSLYNDKSNSIGKRHALVELRRRKILEEDILRYNIGYCEEGEYAHRIIIPSYDENGKLNYFTARSYFKDSPLKYKNPDISKDIISFEMMINWNLPIVLCEGYFDGIAIRRNPIPLLGKSLLDKLHEKIVTKRPPIVYIVLDEDAIKNTIKIAETLFKEDINVCIIKLKKFDPSELGFDELLKMFQSPILINDNSIFRLKMEHGINDKR